MPPAHPSFALTWLETSQVMGRDPWYRFEQNMTRELSKFEDSKEAMLAFAEKRPAVFKGR